MNRTSQQKMEIYGRYDDREKYSILFILLNCFYFLSIAYLGSIWRVLIKAKIGTRQIEKENIKRHEYYFQGEIVLTTERNDVLS